MLLLTYNDRMVPLPLDPIGTCHVDTQLIELLGYLKSMAFFDKIFWKAMKFKNFTKMLHAPQKSSTNYALKSKNSI